ncbi:TetR/AcrR family transcriptional regulator [Melittangium boletus]|nr:TetR/AcrR family transcriptional regulator [Melittangium boletus]
MAEPKRKRRDAESARAEILDAAEKRLVSAGPSGIRLQEVAADAGVSHPTVLHHFGSREALVDAVVARALRSINARLIEALQASRGEEVELTRMLDAVFDSMGASGQGRVLMWLALEGRHVEGDEVTLSAVVDAAQALRESRRGRKKAPPREDTAHLVVLAALVLTGLPVLGPTLLRNSGLDNDADAMRRFRGFLAKMLLRHFSTPE